MKDPLFTYLTLFHQWKQIFIYLSIIYCFLMVTDVWSTLAPLLSLLCYDHECGNYLNDNSDDIKFLGTIITLGASLLQSLRISLLISMSCLSSHWLQTFYWKTGAQELVPCGFFSVIFLEVDVYLLLLLFLYLFFYFINICYFCLLFKFGSLKRVAAQFQLIIWIPLNISHSWYFDILCHSNLWLLQPLMPAA